ncbi:MAG: tetraacyldisaccharide 4'-kinase, partial [Actinobacteria bacterium]|nr:tetraacyldisaccharide 4'-kinase [Actinomycetota bacterium]NIW33176.1 tetraacyldisaccharide 4'-kinase [Actinomycetota bacterium]
GFQHRQLHRDLDIVLIDATAGTLDDRLVPAGNLREPVASLRRADAV